MMAVAIVPLATAGCAAPTQRSVIAVPAARGQGDGRPLHLLPPMQLATDEDAIVRIVGDVTCTGTLIAEDLVLTAHHCVAARDDDGRVQSFDRKPEQISIELGGDYLPWGEVGVRAVVSPNCGYASGEGDIAVLVLTRKLIGISTMSLRLDKGPAGPLPDRDDTGEEITPIGFGRCAASRDAVHRVVRPGGRVRSVMPSQFVAPASICPGDSGGPAYSMGRQEVVGVVSASVMDADERTSAPSIFVRVDAWKPLFSAARAIADGASPAEIPGDYRSCW